uniref:Cyclic nucleotide-binding domain-containing protein n=1 Tax=Acrobeloides nanus TaxID=290746 RepID=A0A914BU79_9BILA
MNGIDFRSMSREELLSEIEKRDELIANMKAELHKYRNQDVANARKIAVSAETATSSDRKVIQKDQHTWDIIESAFLTNDFLCQLEKQQMDEMIESMHQVDVPADSIVIRQGDHGSLLYVLEDGKLQVTKDNRLLRIMDAPCVFGELAILYHCERTASVKALTPCRLWAIERSIFHSIMVNSAKTKHDSLFKFLKRFVVVDRINKSLKHEQKRS